MRIIRGMKICPKKSFPVICLITIITLLSACESGPKPKTKESLRSDISNTQLGSIDYDSINGILVKFKGFVSSAEQQVVLQEVGLKEVQTYSFIPGLVYAEPSTSGPILEAIQALKQHDNVAYAEPDFVLSFRDVVSETLFSEISSTKNKLSQRTIEESSRFRLSDNDSRITKVAILDTGSSVAHNELSQNMWVNVKEIPLNNIDDDHNGWVDDIYGWNFADNHNNILDDNNRGTHVAGIITGKINDFNVSIDDDIKLVTLKIYNKDGYGTLSYVLGAFDYMVKNGVSLSNNSWSISYDSYALKDAIQQLYSYDHLLVFAAGNNGEDIDSSPTYPISYAFSNVLAVSALNETGTSANFSNYGISTVHLSAPGSNIRSTGDTSSYISLSGTSAASAFVTGVAARALHTYKKFSAQNLKSWLLENAQQRSSLATTNNTSSHLSNLPRLVKILDPSAVVDVPQTPPTNTDGDAGNNSSTPILGVNSADVAVGSSVKLDVKGGTAPFTWTIDNSSLGYVDEQNLFHAESLGSVSIYLTDSNNLMSNAITLQIIPMKIIPENISQLTLQQRINISALGGVPPYDWSISDNTIATISVNPIDDAEVELTPIKTGIVTLTLTDSLGNTASIENIEISIPSLMVSPSIMNLAAGETAQINVFGGSSPYQFTSLDDAIATVDLGGFVTAKTTGSTAISVTDADGQVSNISVNISGDLTINAVRRIIAINESLQIETNGVEGVLSWGSSDSAVISVDNTGLLTAHAPGFASINVFDETGRSGSVLIEARQLTLSSSTVSLSVGEPVIKLTVSGGSAPYTWASENDQIVGISQDGWLTAIAPGVTNISAVDADGFSVSKEFTILPAPLTVNQSNLTLAIGDTSQLVLSGGAGNYRWSSTDESIITVDNTGLVTAVALGSSEIHVSDSNGDNVTIVVQVKNIGLAVATTRLLVTDPAMLIAVSGGSEPYTWVVSNTNIASVDNLGWITPVAPGLVTVTVTDSNSMSAAIDITIDATALSITPANVILDINQSQQFTALGGDKNYSWASDNNSIISINEAGLAQAIAVGKSSIILTDGIGQSVSASIDVRQLIISAATNNVTVGEPALVLSVDGGVEPYTWSSDDPSIASVSNSGMLTPISAGNVNITVTDTDGISTDFLMTVTDPILSVSTNNLLLAVGERYLLNAIGGEGNYVWSNSDPSIATVDNTGVVSAVAAGSATITLMDSTGESINIYVEVREINISASTTNLSVGQSGLQLRALGGMAPYTWVSDNSTILDVDQNGLVSALSAGSATISVTDQDGFSGSLVFSVGNSLSVNQSNATLTIGNSITLVASGGAGGYSWTSNNSSIASVTVSGEISAVSAGTATITVTDSMGQSADVVIDVSNSLSISSSNTTLLVSDPVLQINASGGIAPYVWSVNDTSRASINSSGLLTPLAAGMVTVTITDANSNTASLDININVENLTINTTNVLLAPGETYQLTAAGGDANYSWSSNNSSIAAVNSTGRISANSVGSVTIILSDGSGQNVFINVEIREVFVNASSTNVQFGNTLVLSASGGSAPYLWHSSNSSIASVNSSGLLTANGAGSVTVTVTDADGFSGNIAISVSAPNLTISQSSGLIGIDNNLQLNANGGDGSYSWSSSNNSVASVSSSGRVTGNGVGTTTITVRDGLGTSRTANIEVRNVTLSGATSITVGDPSIQISASGGGGSYSWSSSNNSVASINNSGQVTAVAAGSATITATDGAGFSGSISISVSAAPVVAGGGDTGGDTGGGDTGGGGTGGGGR